MSNSCAHIVVIGGTGMLAAATRHLGQDARAITIVARTLPSLENFRSLPQGSNAKLNLVAQDYNEKSGFSEVIADAVRSFGFPEKLVVWMHDMTPAHELAEQLSAYGKPFSFFHVLSSQSASPANNLALQRIAFDHLPFVAYHQIVLGFIQEETGSRWLTNAEISDGTISAIEARLPCRVVGVVRPWNARP